MLLIYAYRQTTRLQYIAKQLFTTVLGIEISITSEVPEFIKYTGPKLSYGKQPLGNEFFIKSHELLFEQGINDHPLKIHDWNGVPCFFSCGDKSHIPYDILAASFYMLSRYEEYLPHVKDSHGRFPPSESVAYQNDFLELPVVDLWAYELLEILKEHFPNIAYKKRSYAFKSLIDVSCSHEFLYRGLIRGFSGFILDFVNLRFKRILNRSSVLLGFKKDPFDNFEYLNILHKKYRIKPIFFFQFAKYGTYDKNVSPYNRKFQTLIKSVSDFAVVGLEASYSSFEHPTELDQEKKGLSEVVHRPIKSVRTRYNRIDIPKTYNELVEVEFSRDYSMGYTFAPGFRAGTCTPFYFYDIQLEVRHPIKIHPFAIQDYSLLKEKSVSDCIRRMDKLYEAVKRVDGVYRVLFSNELLGSEMRINWKTLYQKQLDKFHV